MKVAYLSKKKLKKLTFLFKIKVSSARKISAFKNVSFVVINDKNDPKLVDLGVVLKDSRIIFHDQACDNYVKFAEGGLYRADFSSEIN